MLRWAARSEHILGHMLDTCGQYHTDICIISIEEMIGQPAVVTPTPEDTAREQEGRGYSQIRILYFQKSTARQMSSYGYSSLLRKKLLTGPSVEFPKENIYIKRAFGKPIKIRLSSLD